jgi:hypothetical protein
VVAVEQGQHQEFHRSVCMSAPIVGVFAAPAGEFDG